KPGLLRRARDGTWLFQELAQRAGHGALDLRGRQPPASGVPGVPLQEAVRDVITMALFALQRVTWREAFAGFVEQLSHEPTRCNPALGRVAPRRMVTELPLHTLPLRSLHDRLVLARMAYALVADLTHVDRIGEQLVECTARESLSTRTAAVACDAKLR